MSIPVSGTNTAATRLAALVKGSGKPQTVVAKELGMTGPTVNRYTSGAIAITPDVAIVLAAHFGVRAGWLLFGEGEAPNDAAAYRRGFNDALRQARGVLEAFSTSRHAVLAETATHAPESVEDHLAKKAGGRKRPKQA